MYLKLTVKQKKFSDEYIISGNATDAALKAGYSPKTARFIGAENLSKPNIKSYIDKRLEELEDAAIAKQDEVLKYLTSVMRGEEKEETIISAGDYEQKIVSIDVSARDRIKAAELLGKRYGSWTERQDISLDIPVLFEGEDELED